MPSFGCFIWAYLNLYWWDIHFHRLQKRHVLFFQNHSHSRSYSTNTSESSPTFSGNKIVQSRQSHTLLSNDPAGHCTLNQEPSCGSQGSHCSNPVINTCGEFELQFFVSRILPKIFPWKQKLVKILKQQHIFRGYRFNTWPFSSSFNNREAIPFHWTTLNWDSHSVNGLYPSKSLVPSGRWLSKDIYTHDWYIHKHLPYKSTIHGQ